MNGIKYLTESLLVRVGTFITAALLGYGIHAEHVNVLVPAILAILGVVADIGTGLAFKAYREWQEGR